MQTYREYDQLKIPEKYLKMSAAELHKEKDRVFANLSPITEKTKKSVITTKQKTITFKF